MVKTLSRGMLCYRLLEPLVVLVGADIGYFQDFCVFFMYLGGDTLSVCWI